MIYFCCERLRRNAVRGSALNGIDFIEVLDKDAPTEDDRQKTLFVHLLNDHAGPPFTADNVRIEGGERIRDIVVVDASVGVGPDANLITVEVDEPGDFSIYTLRLVADATHDDPPADFDPQLSAVDFTFKAECPTDFDCKPVRVCPPAVVDEPEIDYLAKDYGSFRRLMLDRMAALVPQWTERNAADVGVTLVELLAYHADHLSYQQDAVATEAYLGTARSRISARRHARLVDYFISDGCNARAWVHVAVSADVTKNLPGDPPVLLLGTQLLTRVADQGVTVAADPRIVAQARAVFETVEPLEELFTAHNELPFYTWSDRECCLPEGATHATLRGHFPNLAPGQVLVFEEVFGPHTGNGADADPKRRHAIRLTEVQAFDAAMDPLIDPLTAAELFPEEVTEIAWHLDDALPAAFCISARTAPEHGSHFVADVSVARGNVVLADHGLSITDEPIGEVPMPRLYLPRPPSDDRCDRPDRIPVPPRFRPTLTERPLTHAGPYDSAAPSVAARHCEQREVEPEITLTSELGLDTDTWHPGRDLLASGPLATEFVVEVEADAAVRLRLGDDIHGARPEAGTAFTAHYRVGNGSVGNLGADTLVHIVAPHAEITAVRNPLPAWGGVDPESIEDVRQRAPSAFRTQERAVTASDYADVTERLADVQEAAATFRWTGSWHTVFLTVDRFGGGPVTPAFEAGVRLFVERFRMAGYDLEVDGPDFVPLSLELEVCVEPGHFRSDVRAALLEVLSSDRLRDGGIGIFHPDNFSFGDTVYLSPIIAAAQSVPGVAGVRAKIFGRLGTPDPEPLLSGELPLGRLEIARLDNDPNFPEHGVLRLSVEGGK